MLTLISGLIVAYFFYILISRKNDKPSTDPPAMAHTALKEIVERAVEEARKLPGLNADVEHPREGRAIADHSYEDLLATAILNKVIEKYQRERVDGNSNVLRDTDSPMAKFETENGLEEEDVSACYRLESNGDCSESIRRNEDGQKPVSFMMEERIEEITTITDDELRDNDVLGFKCGRRVPFPEYGMDIIDPPRELSSPSLSVSSDSSDLNRDEFSPVRTRRHAADHAIDLVSPIESWKDNWLFQKKKSSRSQPDAVAMLVPSSNTDYKALIGDRDAEDTSDLSECSSTKSDEEIEKELIEAINNVIPRTPECNVESNKMLNGQKMLNEKEYKRDEVDACQKETKIEENVVICQNFDENKKNIKVNKSLSEEKAIKDEDNKETQNESFSTLITVAEKDVKAIKSNEEKPKNTIESDEKTIVNIAMESSAQTDVKMQFKKLNERSDRAENVADEEEEQQESEYTEHYDIAIQRHLDSLTKVEVCSGESEIVDETRKITDEQLRKSENNSTEAQKSERSETEVQLSYATLEKDYVDATTDDDRLSAPPRPGTIAEREHKKWENAPPIENNPYSEESIRKRCLERQYSRTSDISGAHYELTKLNEVNLETLLPNRPDIKRFGRDYYINQSKTVSGERQERARSAMSSTSSRPSSSLSQQSSDEQREQQVSQQHELERFEGASLRGSLPRRCCRDPRASPHFAINPLLHLEPARSSANNRSDSDKEQAGNLVGNARTTDNAIEDMMGNRDSRNYTESNLGVIFEKQEDNHVLAKSLETSADFRKLMLTDWNRFWDNDRDGDPPIEEPIVPQYNDSREELPYNCDGRDRDSGMCSIGSRDSEMSERNRWRKLYKVENNDYHDEQISSIGGRRFWTTGKYHTYGGIRSKKMEDLDDFENELISPENCFADHATEFAKLKFQTFGGIKRSRKIDKRKIPNYRRIQLRPVLSEVVISNAEKNRNRVGTETSANFELHSNVDYAGSFDRLTDPNCSTSFKGFASFEHSTSSTFEESDWQDEENDVTSDRVSTRYAQSAHGKNRTSKTSSKIKHKNLVRRSNRNSPSLWSLSTEDDEWQDEIDCASGEIIMNKFLKDVSKRRKAYAFNDDDITAREKESKSRKHRMTLEKNSNKGLRKSMKNNENNLESSKESQMEEQEWKSDNNSKKLNSVRSLSDVTIW